ncbi:MAG TPA: hypothetical protein VGL57_03925 [Solirubrobacteraceae bacterium]|jgi:hypothetical protein
MVPSSTPRNSLLTSARAELVRWVAGLGAVTAEALAVHLQVSVGSARARLLATERGGLLTRCRPLVDRPALYTATRAGLRAAAVRGLEPGRVSAAGALHLIECAGAAAALERCYPDHRVAGERELRRDEREQQRILASADLGSGRHGGPLSHRPDLVLWPLGDPARLPIAVEVELTIKAPERLAAICQAWARARCVGGVLYLAPPAVERALLRAIEQAQAGERVVVVALDALPARLDPPAGDCRVL